MLRLPCGHYRDEASGQDNDDRWSATPRLCHACAALGDAAEQRHKQATQADRRHGVFWELHRHEEG